MSDVYIVTEQRSLVIQQEILHKIQNLISAQFESNSENNRVMLHSDAYSEPCQSSEIERFGKIVNG